MRVIITGGTGFIGGKLADEMKRDGHEIIVLSRNPAKHTGDVSGGVRAVQWDAKTGQGWDDLIDDQTAIVNLAGAPINGEGFFPSRWTDERRRSIRDSRINSGKAIVSAIENAKAKPACVIQSSAIGYYGYHGDEVIEENSPPGTDFLAQVCVDWEASTAPLDAMGIRRPITRTGLVLSTKEGALNRLLLPFKMFAGGPMGSGRQWYSWIHWQDEIGAIQFLIKQTIS